MSTAVKARFIVTHLQTGSQNGLVYAPNKNVQTVRSRATPINRSTPGQTKSRASHRINAPIWHGLTLAGKLAWKSWGMLNPIQNSIGIYKVISGYNLFTRLNRALHSAGLPPHSTAPVVNGYPTYTQATLLAISQTNDIHVEINPADDWANEDGGYMLIWVGHPITGARGRAGEKYVFLGLIAGSSSGIVSGWDFTSPMPVTVIGNGQWVRTSVLRADGRLSI